MDALKKIIIKQLVKIAKPYLQSYGLLKTIKIKSALVWEPAGGKILVLAPHMDDEVIGCGGTLYKHIRKGAEVTVVYITDGRRGSRTLQELKGEEQRKQETNIAIMRKQEAQLAIETLGIKKGIFLDAKDINPTTMNELQNALQSILNSVKPTIVYLPFFLEEHPEHAVVSQLLLAAAKNIEFDFECCAYEVWTPLFPNCFVVIDDAVDIKKQALQHYQSQLADKNYIHTSIGLNAYRSSALLDSDGYAEAFFRVSLKDYRELYNLIFHQHV